MNRIWNFLGFSAHLVAVLMVTSASLAAGSNTAKDLLLPKPGKPVNKKHASLYDAYYTKYLGSAKVWSSAKKKNGIAYLKSARELRRSQEVRDNAELGAAVQSELDRLKKGEDISAKDAGKFPQLVKLRDVYDSKMQDADGELATEAEQFASEYLKGLHVLKEEIDNQVTGGKASLQLEQEIQAVESHDVLAFVVATDEEEGKMQFGSSSYQIVKETLTWHEARKKATAMGGHLAVIETMEEYLHLKQKLPIEVQKAVWLGGTNEVKTGEQVENAPARWINGAKFKEISEIIGNEVFRALPFSGEEQLAGKRYLVLYHSQALSTISLWSSYSAKPKDTMSGFLVERKVE